MRNKSIRWKYLHDEEWISRLLKMVIRKRLDAMYSVQAPPVLYFSRKLNIEDKIRLLYLPEPKTDLYTAFSKKNHDLHKRYEKAFEKVGGRKRYYKMLSEYIDIDSL